MNLKFAPACTKQLKPSDEPKVWSLGYICSMSPPYVQVLLLCSINLIQDMMSINIIIAIVCMVDDSTTTNPNANMSNCDNTFQMKETLTPIQYNSSNQSDAELQLHYTTPTTNGISWNPQMVGTIFSAFDWGLLTIPLIGVLADRFNNKSLLSTFIAIGTTATLVIPFVASKGQLGFGIVIACRVALGVVSAVVTTCSNNVITNWFSKEKRSLPYSFITGGNQLGTLLILAVSGFMCSVNNFWQPGWTLIFYTSAMCSIIVFGLWVTLGVAYPKIPTENQLEEDLPVPKRKLTCELNCEDAEQARSETISETSSDRQYSSTPWMSILTSLPVWASVAAITSSEFCLIMVLIYLPTYLKNVMNISIEFSGLYTALPMVFYWISKVLCSYITQKMVQVYFNSKIARETVFIKIINSIGCIGAIGCFVALVLLHKENWLAAVIVMNIFHIFSGMHIPGCYSTLLTIVPQHVGFITGLTYFIIGIAGAVGPLVIGALTPHECVQSEWQRVFILLGTVQCIPLVVFNMFGTAGPVLLPTVDDVGMCEEEAQERRAEDQTDRSLEQ